jgi:hypothetical protein
MKKWLLIVALASSFSLQAQTFDWWQNNVNWDGATHWWKYLITSPAYFGPNAFTVPAMNNGSIDSVISLGASANFHFSKGDQTQNIMLYGNYTTKQNTISVDAQFVPYERFSMSHEKKTERRVYYKNYYDNNTVGDVVVNTTIQLFNKWRPRFHTALRIGIRMPSGGGQGAARYADVPSYWIDVGWALPFTSPEWKWMGMAGFLVWQTNDDGDLRQNDAFLFGSGLEWNRSGMRVQGYCAGYLGYKNNGDKPIVFRVNIEKSKKRNIYLFRLQQGVNDFDYFSMEAGLKYLFPK